MQFLNFQMFFHFFNTGMLKISVSSFMFYDTQLKSEEILSIMVVTVLIICLKEGNAAGGFHFFQCEMHFITEK